MISLLDTLRLTTDIFLIIGLGHILAKGKKIINGRIGIRTQNSVCERSRPVP